MPLPMPFHSLLMVIVTATGAGAAFALFLTTPRDGSVSHRQELSHTKISSIDNAESTTIHFISTAERLMDEASVTVTATLPAWVFATRGAVEAGAAAAATQTGASAARLPADSSAGVMRGQWGEEKWVHDNFFAGVTGGLILESGALDGLDKSQSWWWVHSLSWRAVHVEASPRTRRIYLKTNQGTGDVVTTLTDGNLNVHSIETDFIRVRSLDGIADAYMSGDIRFGGNVKFQHVDFAGNVVLKNVVSDPTAVHVLSVDVGTGVVGYCDLPTGGGGGIQSSIESVGSSWGLDTSIVCNEGNI